MIIANRYSQIDALGNDDRSVNVLKDILREFTRDVTSINKAIGVVNQRISPPTGGGGVGAVPAPPYLEGEVFPLSILLSWSAPEPPAHLYEIRRHDQLDWDTATFVTRTPSLSVNLAPLQAGGYYFIIKSIDNLGNYSEDVSYVTLEIIAPGAPAVTATVIDNNVLLYWTANVTSHQISYYNIYRNNVLIGMDRGTFTPIFETLAGTYTYAVEPVDIATNVGARGTVTTHVNAPPDFELEDRRISNLDGTRVNVARLPKPSLLACVNLTDTWSTHFTSRGWSNVQSQLTAGYPIYIQPTMTSGSYEEVIDYGVVINNLIVTINYQLTELVPTVVPTVYMAVSVDNVNYTALIAGNSQFHQQFRFLKLHIAFAGQNDKSLAEFAFIQITLDVKKELDSGDAIAYATDPAGTQVNFTKLFKDIDSITCTADAIEPIDVIYDFVDVPNPVGFKVFALDTTGNRVTYTISWKARGIV